MTMTDSGFRLEDAPMARDRTDGWRHVRAAGDVVRTADGIYLLTSTEAVQFAHRHPEIFSSARAFDSLASPVPLIPIAIDPPDHTRYRRILDPMLAPKVINGMEEELRRQARELILAFADRGHCDIVDDLARLYPTQVFLTLFGMPLADRDRFIHWAETIIENSNPNSQAEVAPEVIETAMELFGYLQKCVDEKRANPGEDMLSRVLSFTGDEAWSNEEVLGLCFLFILAGLDTVTAVIGFMFQHLTAQPDVRRRLVEQPDAVQPIVEEVIRLEPPAPLTPRVTTQDVDVCGTLIPAGSPVTLCLGTVNRDPQRFPHPDVLDPDHGDSGHRGFGGGIHRCLGSHLARRELRIIAEEFHKLIPDYELAPGADPHIVWPSGTFHLTSLPIVFPATGRA
jgi:cytochrome P450